MINGVLNSLGEGKTSLIDYKFFVGHIMTLIIKYFKLYFWDNTEVKNTF